MMDTDPLRMPEVTAQAAGEWVRMSLDYLWAERRSVLVETTLRQAAVVMTTMRQFHDAGYRTELRVLAVPGELSRMGTVTRYVRQRVEDGAGRWAASQFHDAAYRGGPETVRQAVMAGVVHRVVVVDRNANVLADVDLEQSRVARQTTELQAVIEDGRAITAITSAQGMTWMRELGDNARCLASWGESDVDLLVTMQNLAERASAVAKMAWPDDSVRASREARRAQAAVDTLGTARR